MKIAIMSLMMISGLTAGGCVQDEKADLVITNAKVYTVNPDAPSAGAVAVKGNTILAVGSSREIESILIRQ